MEGGWGWSRLDRLTRNPVNQDERMEQINETLKKLGNIKKKPTKDGEKTSSSCSKYPEVLLETIREKKLLVEGQAQG